MNQAGLSTDTIVNQRHGTCWSVESTAIHGQSEERFEPAGDGVARRQAGHADPDPAFTPYL
jgi:hypothetical protein